MEQNVETRDANRRASGLAIASMVLGILAWLTFGYFELIAKYFDKTYLRISVPISLIAIVCGHLAIRQVRKEGGKLRGMKLAFIGVFVAGLFALLFFVWVMYLFAVNELPNS